MKKLGFLLLSLLVLISLHTGTADAAELPDFNQELEQYLDEISAIRGFEITKEMLVAAMDGVGQDFSELKNIDEVRNYFGEVIQSDYSNLKNILDTYQLTFTEVVQLLADYGEELNDYVFLDELEFAVYFYVTVSAPAVTEFPSDVKEPVHESEDVSVVDEQELPIPRTEKGGKLPKTADGYLSGAVLGLMLLIFGLILLKKVENEKKKLH